MHRIHRDGSALPPALLPVLLPVLLAVLLAGCSVGTVVETAAPPGYLPDAAARTATVDWTRAETADVAMQEFSFHPATLTFQAGHPYRLRIANRGRALHTFFSTGFFQAIAAKSLTTDQGTIEAPYVRNIELASGRSADLLFLAVTPGDYALICHEPMHESFGMSGSLRIR